MRTTTRPVVAIITVIAVAGVLGACSDDDKDGPPATETPVSVAEDVAAPTETATPDPVGADPADTVPASGIGAINGPATVDSSFSGANPDGGGGGG
jgi:hypothetical protein